MRKGSWLPWRADERAQALWLWGAFIVVIVLLRLDQAPSTGNVCTIYQRTGERFLAGESLYAPQRFFYLPSAAVLFAAFAWMPFTLCAALWRAANLAVFAAGMLSLAGKGRGRRSVGVLIASLVTILLCIGAARHGQNTLMMAGWLMLGVHQTERGRPWLSACFLALGLAVKPLALPLLVLVALLYPTIRWKLVGAVGAVLLLPFLFQSPAYVLQQYADVPRMLGVVAEVKAAALAPTAIGLLQTLGLETGAIGRAALWASVGSALLMLCLTGRRSLPTRGDRALLLYGSFALFCLLCSVATERNTYAMLAPIVGILWCTAARSEEAYLRVPLAAIIAMNLAAHTVGKAFPDTPFTMLKVMAAIGVGIVLYARVRAGARLTPVAPEEFAARAYGAGSEHGILAPARDEALRS